MLNLNQELQKRESNQNQMNKKFDCDNDGFEKKVKWIRFNNNYELPFFAYGIFKPGQLAYSIIEKHIDDKKTVKEPSKIPYRMYIRDGIPLIVESKKDFDSARGYLIYFKKGNIDIIKKRPAFAGLLYIQ